jgi:transcription elongation GreA/GreB family factor
VVRHYLVPDVNLGTLVTFVGDAADLEEVNSVVTSQTFNVAEGTISTQTQFAQLDLRGVT